MAMMEQATSGQIGQPAACMIESKRGSSAGLLLSGALRAPVGAANYRGRGRCKTKRRGRRTTLTKVVDNFVENNPSTPPQAAPILPLDRTMTK
jgi:hypothetical protein